MNILFSRRGFTLIEILVVVAVIGVLIAGAASLDLTRSKDIENKERIVRNFLSSFVSARNRQITGEPIGGYTGVDLTTVITLSYSGLLENYYSGSALVGTGNVYITPMLDNDPRYQVSEIRTYSPTGVSTLVANGSSVVAVFAPGVRSFSGVHSGEVALSVTLKYLSRTWAVYFDRRTGLIERR